MHNVGNLPAALSAALPLSIMQGELQVAYIDTEGTFRPERIRPIAERYGLDVEAVMDNV